MTLHDERTVVLPASPDPSEGRADAERASPMGLTILLVVVLIALIVAMFWTVDAIIRAQVQHTVAEEWRADFGLPDTQHLDVDVSGPAVPQALFGRFDSIRVTTVDLVTGPTTVDLEATLGGVHVVDGEMMTAETFAGEMRLGAAQATALLVPSELEKTVRVGFRGSDMTVDLVATAAGSRMPVSVALTPRLVNGSLQTSPASLTIGDKTVSADQLASALGGEGAGAVQPAAVCVAAMLPRFVTVRSIEVRDQHLLMGFDLDMTRSGSLDARQPGACS